MLIAEYVVLFGVAKHALITVDIPCSKSAHYWQGTYNAKHSFLLQTAGDCPIFMRGVVPLLGKRVRYLCLPTFWVVSNSR
jgi:hypothetical protein